MAHADVGADLVGVNVVLELADEGGEVGGEQDLADTTGEGAEAVAGVADGLLGSALGVAASELGLGAR